jgi:hypothetical protein
VSPAEKQQHVGAISYLRHMGFHASADILERHIYLGATMNGDGGGTGARPEPLGMPIDSTLDDDEYC